MPREEIGLKTYVDQRFADNDKAVLAALASTDKRLDGMNEFRQALSDQQKNFLTREEFTRAHSDLVTQVTQLNSRMDKREGEKTESNNIYGYAVGIAGVLFAVLDLIFRFLGK